MKLFECDECFCFSNITTEIDTTSLLQQSGPKIADMRWIIIIVNCASVTSTLPNLKEPKFKKSLSVKFVYTVGFC